MKAYILYPDGHKFQAVPRPRGDAITPDTFSWEELQDLVGGYTGMIDLAEDVVMVYNENYRMTDKEWNPHADALLSKCKIKTEPMRGPVLVCLKSMID